MMVTPQTLYTQLVAHFGSQHWWPIDQSYHQQHQSDPRVEIIIGAILTQNTAWNNVEKALENLKAHSTLSIPALVDVEINQLKQMIQPSGFFNQKAQRLKTFAVYFHKNYHSNLDHFFQQPLEIMRNELLSLSGIGPETADSILLYAGEKPVFVVDAYTKRLCSRLPLQTSGKTYEDIQHFFDQHLRKSYQREELVPLFKELHALIVIFAKTYCKTKPACLSCPLKNYCSVSLS